MEVKPEEGYKGLELLVSALRRNKEVRIDVNKLWKDRDKNLYVKYRENFPSVLKNIDLTIQSGNKVGIVGRTAAEKFILISSI